MSRKTKQMYPDLTAFVDEIDLNGISAALLYKIINKHRPNSRYNEKLYKRYQVADGEVPIFKRAPRYEEDKPINNQVNNDFFSEIVDFKTGYFAGQPIAYGYSKGEEAEEVTGGVEAVDVATKTLTDFITRNNMYGVDMETTKYASIYGYAGRLFYVDTEGNERVMPVHGYETIILSKTDISEPKYAIRYFKTYDVNDNEKWVVEFYDNQFVTTYEGMLSSLEQMGEPKLHLFDYCPLQGIANNKELIGDAEKVLALIDDYDKVLSDNSNELEAFVHAYMVFENLGIDKETAKELQKSGIIDMKSVGVQEGKVYFLTKNINDAFTEHHLQRLEDNIYRFSHTPNLSDDTFGSASGVSLKFKLHGLETKCGMFEAKMLDASQYMFKVLASAWGKKAIAFDPLQVTLDFKRNFPLDEESIARTMQAYKAVGMPMDWIVRQAPSIEDPNWVMDLIAEEQSANVENMYPDIPPEEVVNEELNNLLQL